MNKRKVTGYLIIRKNQKNAQSKREKRNKTI